MSEIRIETQDGERAYQPGDAVEVTCAWKFDEPPDAMEVRLVWYTEGKGTQDVNIALRESLEDPQAMDLRRLTLTLPEGPYSFSGKLISLRWALELVAEPSEESHRVDLIIAPGGVEVQLPQGKAAELPEMLKNSKIGAWLASRKEKSKSP